MRKIACLFLMFFALVQMAPSVQAICTDITTVFIADEEKGEEKGTDSENKEKKDYPAYFFLMSSRLTQKINTAFHLTEKIHPSPCLEKLIPPPNFC